MQNILSILYSLDPVYRNQRQKVTVPYKSKRVILFQYEIRPLTVAQNSSRFIEYSSLLFIFLDPNKSDFSSSFP